MSDERGRLAARVFELLEHGRSLDEIGLETGESREVIWSLYLEYVTPFDRPVPKLEGGPQ